MHTRLFIGGLALLMAALMPAVLSPGTVHGDPDDLITNGGFEAGTTFDSWTIVDQPGSEGTWCPQSGTSDPSGSCSVEGSATTVPAPPEGSTAAMTGHAEAAGSVLYQCVTLLTGLSSATLSFQLYLNNEASDYASPPRLNPKFKGSNQQFRADVVTNAGIGGDSFTLAAPDVLLNVYQTDPGDPLVSGYTLLSSDVSDFAGQDVCVRFGWVASDAPFNAGVDDVRLEIQMPTPTDTPLTPQPTATVAATIFLPRTVAAGYGALRLRPNGCP